MYLYLTPFKQYKKLMKRSKRGKRLATIKEGGGGKFSKKCKNIGFDLLQINSDDDYIKFLMQFFRSRAKRS